jgi:simple sugar transport system permease protein
MENFLLVFNHTLFHATIRASTPILYATLSCVLTQQADILNVGVEGAMLSSAFAAVYVSYSTGSWFAALLAAILTGAAISAFMAIAHLRYGADIFVVGMGVNMLALGVTRFLMQRLLGLSGMFYDQAIVPLPRIKFDADLGPVLNSLLNDYSIFEPLGIALVFVIAYALYRTVWGLRLRGVGLNPMAAETAGINVRARKFEVMIWSGILGGMAGAYLSLGYSRMFVENMTNGRGFMGVAAMYFGGANPVLGWVGCLIFGFADSVASRLQSSFGMPPQFILAIPFIVTVGVLAAAMMRSNRRELRRKSAI